MKILRCFIKVDRFISFEEKMQFLGVKTIAKQSILSYLYSKAVGVRDC